MRAFPALALSLLLLLAGCVTPGAEQTPAASLDPVAGLPAVGKSGVFTDALGKVVALPEGAVRALGGQFDLGLASTEPTIAAGKDGALFMTAMRPNPNLGAAPEIPFANFRAGPTIIRTLDKGQTMEDVGPTLPTGESQRLRTYDPFVLVDPETGRVFMDDIWPLGCGMLAFSDDDGASWTTNPASCGNPNVNDHQSLAVGKPRRLATVGYPNLVYRCVNNVANAACAVSVNGGLTFTPQLVAWTPDECGVIFGHILTDLEGRLIIPKADCSGEAVLFVSEDDGLTYTKRVVSPEGGSGHDLDVAVDEENNYHAVWSANGLVSYAYSRDLGETWSEPRVVAAPGVTATMFGAVAAGAPGKVAIAYVGTTIEGGYDGKTEGNGGIAGNLFGQPEAPDWENATWNGYLVVIDDAFNGGPMQSVTVNDPADPFARGLCGGTRCHGMNDFLDVVIDADGRPWGAFVDVCSPACAAEPGMDFDFAMGTMGTLLEGPALRGAAAALPPLMPQMPREGA